MPNKNGIPLLATIPHSGESIPAEATWLKELPRLTQMRDVDRFVDRLYKPLLKELSIPSVIADIHRYVIDLNRKEEEFDASAVEGAALPAGTHPKGLHWSMTTQSEVLIAKPMSQATHQHLMKEHYYPFHQRVEGIGRQLLLESGRLLHLDLHSMPGRGTSLHPDPGQERAEVVLSDFHGKSCDLALRDLVLTCLQRAGLEVAYNWPYIGGGITQRYGQPTTGWSTLQIELNRSAYMNEVTQEWEPQKAQKLQSQLRAALVGIQSGLERGV